MGSKPQKLTFAGSLVRRGLYVYPAVILSASVAPAQWVQWGGPHQDFKVASTGLASEWSEAGPRRIWKRELGEGYSAILVDEGRLYTMYRKGKEEIIVSLDAKTGHTIWEYKYFAQPAEGHFKQFGEGPRSTPLIVGDFLYAVGVSGKMTCLTKRDGKKKWSTNLWKTFKGNILPHGYASSPIAYRDTVIVLVGGKGAGIVALNQDDGKVVWKSQDFKNSYSTPKLITVDGADQLVTFMASEIIGLDPKDGHLEWKYDHANRFGQNVCMPIWNEKNNILFFSSPMAGSRGLKLTRKDGRTEIEELWSTRKIQFYHVTAIGIDDYVYGTTGTQGPKFFAAINMQTGKVAWRERGFGKATCLYADGHLIILDEDGDLALATATPEKLDVRSKATVLESKAWTVPTLAGHQLYLRDKKSIMALDLG